MYKRKICIKKFELLGFEEFISIFVVTLKRMKKKYIFLIFFNDSKFYYIEVEKNIFSLFYIF